jgi:transportin-1
MISNMLRLLSDPSKKVQEAACSALATFSEEAGHSLVPYMQHILPTLLSTFEFYSGRNLIILYDTVASLAENVGFNGSKENCDLVLRTLEKKWNMLQNDDTEIFQLFECLSAVSSCMKHGFKDFAAPVYNRCIVLIQGTLTSLMKFYHNNGEGFGQEPDSDFIVYSLDLISSVICALGPLSIHFLDEKLMHVLPSCLQERNSSVRQSAAGVVGDLAMNCFDYIKGFSDSFVNLLIPLVDHIASDLDYNVSNNATWALGEIAMRHKFDAKAFVAKLLAVKEIIEIPRSLRENVAVTIGRLGILHSEFVSPYLENIAQFWCKTLRNTRDNPEKESSFIGFCKIVQENPNAIISVFPLFCDAIVGCKDVQNTTKQLFGVRIINKNRFFNYQQVLLAFKAMIGPQWDPYYSNFPQNLRQGLSFYGL